MLKPGDASSLNMIDMKNLPIGYLVVLLLFSACAAVKKVDKDADAFANYREDLGGTVIAFPPLAEQAVRTETPSPIESNLAVDRDLGFALERFMERNRSQRNWNGFTVLVFSGVSREAAFKTRDDLYTNFEGIKVEMQYQQPRYLVKAGRFINRIEAQAYYHRLKTDFPSARIIQDRFQREGYVNPDPIPDVER